MTLTTNAANRCAWSARAHQSVAAETLCYLGLAFGRSDIQDSVLPVARSIESAGVRNYSIFGVFGDLDLLLTVWIPPHVSASDLLNSVIQDTSAVKALIAGTDAVFEPSAALSSSSDLAFSMDLLGGMMLRSFPTHLLDISSLDQFTQEGVSYLVSRGFLVREPSSREHLRFFTFGSSPELRIGRRTLSPLERLAQHSSPSDSLFIVRAAWAHDAAEFVVEGISSNVSTIREFVLALPRQLELSPGSCRLATYIAADTKPLQARDALSRAEIGGSRPAPIERLLLQDEVQSLEFKATAFVALPHLIKTGALKMDDRIQDSIAASVVGMLNSDGGDVIVGVADSNSNSGIAAFEQPPFPVIEYGGRLLVGIGPDIALMGGGIDKYTRRVRHELLRRITPDALAMVKLSIEELKGVELLRLNVSSGGKWWYFRQAAGMYEFYVRQGAQTIPLRGPEADEFKAARPRSSTTASDVNLP